jgi:hypothetical protein
VRFPFERPPPSDLPPCHAECVAKPGKGARNRLKTVRTIVRTKTNEIKTVLTRTRVP